MHALRTWCSAIVAVAASGLTARADTKIPFEQLAKDFRSRVGLETVDPAGTDLEQVLRSGAYVGLDLGTFEVWHPVAELSEKSKAEDFQQILLTVVRLYDVWLDWAYQNQPGLPEAKKDLASIAKWIESWPATSLRNLDPRESPSLYDLLGAKDEIKEASRRLRILEDDGIKARAWDGGWKLDEIHVTRLLFCPTRKCFLEHTAFAGEIDQEQRPNLWIDDMAGRSSSWCGRTQMIALENAVYPLDFGQPFRGSAMDHYDKSGLEQHVVERAAMSLLRDIYYYLGTHFFEDALATNLVIAVCGRNLIGFTWSQEWRQQGASVQAYERFVPGGNPSGGALPQRLARPGPLQMQVTYVSEWNQSKGENYFRDPLRKAQKKGYPKIKGDKDRPSRDDKNAHFLLHNETGGETVVTAPFFGPDSEQKSLPPNAFLDDYEEFFRAYRSAFFEWLRLHGGSDEPDSLLKFSLLIEGQATRDKDAPLHAVVEKVYGLPLSAADGSIDSLEWRFLEWLAKGK